MKVEEKVNQGLKREYHMTIAANDIDGYVDDEVKKIAPSVRMAGFRPGKVPPNLIRKMHGSRLSGDALNKIVDKSVRDLIEERKLQPAMQPNVKLEDGYKFGKDAELTVTMEVLPQITAPDIVGLKLEKLHVRTEKADVDAALERLAADMKQYKPAKKGKAAAEGDQIIVNYKGSIKGKFFDGGSADGAAIELGSGRMIPGFEEQLVGVKAGDNRDITVTFPSDYAATDLAGKVAKFAVTVKEVRSPQTLPVDDSLAKSLGMQNIGKLREIIESQLEQENEGLTRTHMKRCLLDILAADHDFDVPETMVETEFNQIWQQALQEIANENPNESDAEAAFAELEKERDDLHAIAERRVRLGLLLSEVGRVHDVQISNEEMRRLISQEAQKYRSDEQARFLEFIQENPLAAAQLRAPLYEEKVVDFLFDQAELTERTVSRAEIEAAIEAGLAMEQEAAKAQKKSKAKGAKAKGSKATKAKPTSKPASTTKGKAKADKAKASDASKASKATKSAKKLAKPASAKATKDAKATASKAKAKPAKPSKATKAK